MTTTATMCVNDGGLINPDAFPVRGGDLDLGAITGAAAGVRAMATAVHDETSSISSTWTGLSAGYEAPEQQQVYDLMNPAVTASDELKSAFDSMGGHLDTYASTLEGIKTRLEDFETKAADFRAEVINGVEVIAAEGNDANVGDYAAWAFQWVPGVEQRTTTVPWDQDTATWERNEALLEEYAGLLAEVSAAAAQCANDINALLTNSCVPYVEAIPAEAFTDPENPMPWGEAGDEDRNCPEATGNGAVSVWNGARDFVVNTVQGAGMLLSFNPETGQMFDGETFLQAWGGLGDLAGSIVLLASPVGWVAAGMAATGNNDNDFSDFMYDRSVTVLGAGGSLVGYDISNPDDPWHKWKEDGIATGVESVLNVGTFFIPGGQVGAGLKGGSAAARVAHVAGTVADIIIPGGSWALKGGVRVVSGLDGALRFGPDGVPHLGPMSRIGVPDGTITAQGLIDAMDGSPAQQATPPPSVSDSIVPSRETAGTSPSVTPDAPGGSTSPSPADPTPNPADPTPGSGDATPGPVDSTPGGTVPEDGTAPGQPDPGSGTPAPDGGTAPEVHRPENSGPGRPYDPDAPVRETTNQSDAPRRPSESDVEQALRDAPVDEQGRPVDHRNGEPLRPDTADGSRGWHMKWDAEGQQWVAENPGNAQPGANQLAPTGEPNSFGYDANGDRLPYANHRPDYAPDQVESVWEAAKDENGEVWAEGVDGEDVLIEWEPGEPRNGVWDMGHLPESKYSSLRERYLSGQITTEQFLVEYRNPANYRVEVPEVNRSHRNE